jgi:hypothetical protein
MERIHEGHQPDRETFLPNFGAIACLKQYKVAFQSTLVDDFC